MRQIRIPKSAFGSDHIFVSIFPHQNLFLRYATIATMLFLLLNWRNILNN